MRNKYYIVASYTLIVIASSISLMDTPPLNEPDKDFKKKLFYLDIILTIIFISEIVAKYFYLFNSKK